MFSKPAAGRVTGFFDVARADISLPSNSWQKLLPYVVGQLYGINPLDQPAVEKTKKLAIQILSGGRTS
jgi:hypothetical protein